MAARRARAWERGFILVGERTNWGGFWTVTTVFKRMLRDGGD